MKKSKRGFFIWPNYHFREQMPMIGELLSDLKEKKVRDSEVKATSGVSPSTLRDWRGHGRKKTRIAYASTLERVGRCVGKTLALVKWDGKN